MQCPTYVGNQYFIKGPEKQHNFLLRKYTAQKGKYFIFKVNSYVPVGFLIEKLLWK